MGHPLDELGIRLGSFYRVEGKDLLVFLVNLFVDLETGLSLLSSLGTAESHWKIKI